MQIKLCTGGVYIGLEKATQKMLLEGLSHLLTLIRYMLSIWTQQFDSLKTGFFTVCKKCMSRLDLTIFFAVVCWGAGIKGKDANRLDKVVKKMRSVVGFKLANLKEVVRDRMLSNS